MSNPNEFESTHFAGTDESLEHLKGIKGGNELSNEELIAISNIWKNIKKSALEDPSFIQAYSKSSKLAQAQNDMVETAAEKEMAAQMGPILEAEGIVQQEFSVANNDLDYFHLITSALNSFRDLSQTNNSQTTQDDFTKALQDKLLEELPDRNKLQQYANFLNEALSGEDRDLCKHMAGSQPGFTIAGSVKDGSDGKVKIKYSSDTTIAKAHSQVTPEEKQQMGPNGGRSKKGHEIKQIELGKEVPTFKPLYQRANGSWMVELTKPGIFKQGTAAVLTEKHLAGRKLEPNKQQPAFIAGTLDQPQKVGLLRSPTASSNNSTTSFLGRWGNSSTSSLDSRPAFTRTSTMTSSLTDDSAGKLSHSTSDDSLRSKYSTSTSMTSEAPSLFDKDQGSISNEDLLKMSGLSEKEIQEALKAQAEIQTNVVEHDDLKKSIDAYLETQDTLIKATIKNHYRDHVSREGNPVITAIVTATKAALNEKIMGELSEYKPILESMPPEQKKDLISQTIQDVTSRNIDSVAKRAVEDKCRARYSKNILPELIRKPESVKKTGKEIQDIPEPTGSKRTR